MEPIDATRVALELRVAAKDAAASFAAAMGRAAALEPRSASPTASASTCVAEPLRGPQDESLRDC